MPFQNNVRRKRPNETQWINARVVLQSSRSTLRQDVRSRALHLTVLFSALARDGQDWVPPCSMQIAKRVLQMEDYVCYRMHCLDNSMKRLLNLQVREQGKGHQPITGVWHAPEGWMVIRQEQGPVCSGKVNQVFPGKNS